MYCFSVNFDKAEQEVVFPGQLHAMFPGINYRSLTSSILICQMRPQMNKGKYIKKDKNTDRMECLLGLQRNFNHEISCP